MGKAKLLGQMKAKPAGGNKERLRWEKQNHRQEVKNHIDMTCWYGGADTGCLKSAVVAGMRKKKK